MKKDDSDSDSTGSSVDAIDIGSTMYRYPADMFCTSPADLPVTKSAIDGASQLAGEEESRFGIGLSNFDATKRPRRRSESDIQILPSRRATAE